MKVKVRSKYKATGRTQALRKFGSCLRIQKAENSGLFREKKNLEIPVNVLQNSAVLPSEKGTTVLRTVVWKKSYKAVP